MKTQCSQKRKGPSIARAVALDHGSQGGCASEMTWRACWDRCWVPISEFLVVRSCLCNKSQSGADSIFPCFPLEDCILKTTFLRALPLVAPAAIMKYSCLFISVRDWPHRVQWDFPAQWIPKSSDAQVLYIKWPSSHLCGILPVYVSVSKHPLVYKGTCHTGGLRPTPMTSL